MSAFFLLFTACGLLLQKIVAVFGPETEEASSSVQGVCESMDLPHVTTTWQRSHKYRTNDTVSLNLFPANRFIELVLRDLVVKYNWQSSGVMILYESYEGKLGQ